VLLGTPVDADSAVAQYCVINGNRHVNGRWQDLAPRIIKPCKLVAKTMPTTKFHKLSRVIRSTRRQARRWRRLCKESCEINVLVREWAKVEWRSSSINCSQS